MLLWDNIEIFFVTTQFGDSYYALTPFLKHEKVSKRKLKEVPSVVKESGIKPFYFGADDDFYILEGQMEECLEVLEEHRIITSAQKKNILTYFRSIEQNEEEDSSSEEEKPRDIVDDAYQIVRACEIASSFLQDDASREMITDLVHNSLLSMKRVISDDDDSPEVSVTDRVQYLGYELPQDDLERTRVLKKIGRIASDLFLDEYGHQPQKRTRIVGNASFTTNRFTLNTCESTLDEAIHRVFEEN